MIVAIDGPAGAGKSTVARALAARLGIGYLNTGSMYRAVTLLALRTATDVTDGEALAALAADHVISLESDGAGERVFVDGVDVADAIRASTVTDNVSVVAAHAAVRERIVAMQRRVLATGDWVADGRDIGSVVCPEAEVKVYLTADPAERARRRHAELITGGDDVTLGDVLQQIEQRDAHDSGREESPLVIAPGARVVDTTGATVAQIVEELASMTTQVSAP